MNNSYKEKESNQIIKSTLYIVATPIGNLSDISARALKMLSEVDFIAAEDTRVTGKLLAVYNIKKPMINYHEHNKILQGEYIAARLQSGDNCALVTDAGTPAISDPGTDIIKMCIDRNINVINIPGPCAFISALTVSGMDTDRFIFLGFFNKLSKDELEKLYLYEYTLIFYEAPHHLKKTLEQIKNLLGNRKITICRELTKINEEILRFSVEEAIEYYLHNEPRGEYVLIVGSGENNIELFWHKMTIVEHVNYYMENIGFNKNEAIKAAARDRKITKNTIYKELI